VQPFGGAGEVELFRERQQRAQVPHLDVHGQQYARATARLW
jgi:hypothetical protein